MKMRCLNDPHRRPYWTGLRAVGNNPAVRLTILIPLIGYFILLNDYFVSHIQLSEWLFQHPKEVVLELTRTHDPKAVIDEARGEASKKSNGPPYRLFVIYFGLCFLAAASAAYQFRCPDEVKAFSNASEYVAHYLEKASGVEITRIEDALREGDDQSKKDLKRIEDAFARIEKLSMIDDQQRQQRREAETRNLLQYHFDMLNRGSACTRRAAHYFYWIGFICLGGSSVDIFCRVIRVLVVGFVSWATASL